MYSFTFGLCLCDVEMPFKICGREHLFRSMKRKGSDVNTTRKRTRGDMFQKNADWWANQNSESHFLTSYDREKILKDHPTHSEHLIKLNQSIISADFQENTGYPHQPDIHLKELFMTGYRIKFVCYVPNSKIRIPKSY